MMSETILNHMVNNSFLLDEVFGALASEPRRQIISMLQRGSYTMTEISKPLKISLPATHKHIKILENAQLLRRTKVGREQKLTLEVGVLQEAEEWIERHRMFWNQQLDTLEEYLTRKNGEL